MAEPAYLLDSNICIYVLEGVGPSLRQRIEQQAPGSIVTSAVCYAEVMRGVAADDTARNARAERLFALIEPLAFGRDAALAYRALPFRRATYDRLIAAHALSLGLTLVTNNAADFGDVTGLRVENWAG